jgi:hypothetical protein
MIYTITNPNSKEWNEKKFVEATLVDDKGEEFKVSAWAGEFSNEDGSFKATIDGELSKNDKGYWKLNTPKKAAGGAYMNAQRVEGQKEVEKIRNENIKQNMHDKEESIAWFNSRNTALEFVKVYVCNPQVSSVAEAVEAIEKYTKIFYAQWSTWDNQPF